MNAILLVLALHVTAAPPVTEYHTYNEAYREAAKTGKPLVVLVCASWCGPCQTMKNTVLPEIGRRGVLKDFSVALVDVDAEQQLVQRLGASGPVPQLFCFSKGKLRWHRSKLIGGRGVDQVVQFLRTAASHHESEPGRETQSTVAVHVKRSDSLSDIRPTSGQLGAQETAAE